MPFGVEIQLCTNFGEGMLRGQKPKICRFFYQLIENQKLHNIFENQPPKSIWRGDMGFPPISDRKSAVPLLTPLQIGLASRN